MIKAIETRCSIRGYSDKPVSDELVIKLIESARLAPYGMNTQPWNFIIVRDQVMKEEIAKIDGNQVWMNTAPVFIVCVADMRSRIKDDSEIFVDEHSGQRELKQIIRDTAVAIEHILLEAENLGLSTCWTGLFIQSDIRPLLAIPDDKYVVGVVTVGYPGDANKPDRKRRDLESMIRYEKW